MRAKVLGSIVTDITREDRTIGIRLRVQEQFRDSARSLHNLIVAQAGTTAIPLSAVAEVQETIGPTDPRRAGQIRLRPILMTTGTTVPGLLPMAVGHGEGSELPPPMAWPVIGGLLSRPPSPW